MWLPLAGEDIGRAEEPGGDRDRVERRSAALVPESSPARTTSWWCCCSIALVRLTLRATSTPAPTPQPKSSSSTPPSASPCHSRRRLEWPLPRWTTAWSRPPGLLSGAFVWYRKRVTRRPNRSVSSPLLIRQERVSGGKEMNATLHRPSSARLVAAWSGSGRRHARFEPIVSSVAPSASSHQERPRRARRRLRESNGRHSDAISSRLPVGLRAGSLARVRRTANESGATRL